MIENVNDVNGLNKFKGTKILTIGYYNSWLTWPDPKCQMPNLMLEPRKVVTFKFTCESRERVNG